MSDLFLKQVMLNLVVSDVLRYNIWRESYYERHREERSASVRGLGKDDGSCSGVRHDFCTPLSQPRRNDHCLFARRLPRLRRAAGERRPGAGAVVSKLAPTRDRHVVLRYRRLPTVRYSVGRPSAISQHDMPVSGWRKL